MSIPVPYRLVEKAVRRFETLQPQPGRSDQPAPPARVITISRQLGSGGRLVAEQLGATLGWPVWDREILDVLANQSSRQIEARLFQALDERSRSDVLEMIRPWETKVSTYSYQYLLPKAILTIAHKDAIIIGRGAHLFLPRSLKVRIVAPIEARVRNLQNYDQLDETTARQQIAESDRERAAFVRSLAQLRAVKPPDPETEYDLLINTGVLDVSLATRLVLAAADARFGLPQGKTALRPAGPPAPHDTSVPAQDLVTA